MSKESIAGTLRMLRKRYGYTLNELVEKLSVLGIKVNSYTLSRWENGVSAPPLSVFIALCRLYQVKDLHAVFIQQDLDTIGDGLNREGREKLEDYKQLLIGSGKYAPIPSRIAGDQQKESIRRTRPLYDLRPSAGTGQFLDSDAYEMVEIDADVPDEASFGVRVGGDSMEPTLMNGQVIWVHQQPTLENGDIGVFFIDGDAFVKEYHITSEGACLISHNPKYAPIRIKDDSSTRIYGRVVSPRC